LFPKLESYVEELITEAGGIYIERASGFQSGASGSLNSFSSIHPDMRIEDSSIKSAKKRK